MNFRRRMAMIIKNMQLGIAMIQAMYGVPKSLWIYFKKIVKVKSHKIKMIV